MGVNSIPKFANGIGIGIDGIVPMTALNTMLGRWWPWTNDSLQTDTLQQEGTH